MPASPDDTMSTRSSLLRRVRDPADCPAWEDFAAVYTPLIRRYAVRKGLQAADADDLCQAVLAEVSTAIRGFRYDPGRGSFRGWLGRVTHNLLRKHWAKARRRPAAPAGLPPLEELGQLGVAGTDPVWFEEFSRHVLGVAQARVCGEFEASTWAAFEGGWTAGEDPPAVARRLGLSVHAVYVAKSRVLRRLHDEVLAIADDLPHAGGP